MLSSIKKLISILENRVLVRMKHLDIFLTPRMRNKVRCLREVQKNILETKARPQKVQLLCQAECNFSCEFCGFDYRTQPIKSQLTFENFKIILSHLDVNLLNSITFSGQGEPLLCHDLEKMVKYIKKHHSRIRTHIITNGALLEGKKADMVAQYFDLVEVSLHSVQAETHKIITKSNTFDKVMENLFTLRKAYPDLKIDLYFSYSMRNIDEIKKHIDLAVKLGNCGINGAYTKFYSKRNRFSRKSQKLLKPLDSNLSLFYHQDYADQRFEEAVEYAKSLGYNNYNFCPSPFKNQHRLRNNCDSPYSQIMVNYDGTVFPCGGSENWMFDDIASNTLDFGNLLTSHIDEIWNNKDYQNLRQSSKGSCENRIISRCNNCSMLCYYVDSGNIFETHFIEF